MEAHLHEWANLLIRWAHLTVGIAWIGASFYFNWLENNLERQNARNGVAGDLWAIHGGGFYYLQKYEVAPPRLPEHLHWFKWEAYFTWITGFVMLWVVYYFNASTMMLAPQSGLAPWQAVAVGLVVVIGSWFVYDGLCRSALAKRPSLLALVGFVLLVILAWGLSQIFSGRAAYIHVGAAIGTCMVANVFRVIIPGQRAMVEAMQQGEKPDPAHGRNGLLRSRHNNYLTLPVLFLMISNHYPGTYSSQWGWAILAALMVISAGVRHYFNIRHKLGAKVWILPAAGVAMVVLILATAPSLHGTDSSDAETVSLSRVEQIVTERCAGCHAAEPSFAGFTSAPLDIRLDSAERIRAHMADIQRVAVQTHYMPLGNVTQMTDEERATVGAWVEQQTP
ncbi:urate hydroxylase PuuD [Halomonas sp. WWR20]